MEMFGFNIGDYKLPEIDPDIKVKITELLIMMDVPILDVNIRGVFEYINLIRTSGCMDRFYRGF